MNNINNFHSEEHYLQTVELFNSDKKNPIYGVHFSEPEFMIKYRAGNYFSPTFMRELKTEEEIIEFVAPFGISREECYCRECGKFLLGENVSIYFSNYRGKKTIFFTNRHCFLNFQTYGTNTIYRLSVCDDCISSKFSNFSADKQFNMTTDYSRYAFNVPVEVINNYNSKTYAHTEDKFIAKFGEEKGHQEYLNYKKKTATNLENFILKYGEIEGRRRWEKYVNFQAEKNTFEYKNKKYGMTLEEFDEYNRQRNSFSKIENDNKTNALF